MVSIIVMLVLLSKSSFKRNKKQIIKKNLFLNIFQVIQIHLLFFPSQPIKLNNFGIYFYHFIYSLSYLKNQFFRFVSIFLLFLLFFYKYYNDIFFIHTIIQLFYSILIVFKMALEIMYQMLTISARFYSDIKNCFR